MERKRKIAEEKNKKAEVEESESRGSFPDFTSLQEGKDLFAVAQYSLSKKYRSN